jgi:hypothetical protein
MGQYIVFEWLKNRRESGDDSFFLPKDIEKALKSQGLINNNSRIRGECFKLWLQGNGCLEMEDQDKKGLTNWLKAFRIKKEYCKNGK